MDIHHQYRARGLNSFYKMGRRKPKVNILLELGRVQAHKMVLTQPCKAPTAIRIYTGKELITIRTIEDILDNAG